MHGILQEVDHPGVQVLPDMTGWPYKGSMMMNGERVNLWQYEKKHQAKTTRYSFYVRDNGSPVKLHQHGNDIFTGSHFDEWLVRLPERPSAERCCILSLVITT